MKTQVNYIIVGQGLAGTILAHTLLQNGKSVLIIDAPSFSKASRVAAGIYNPVVFKRLVKSWLADELLEYMDEFYPATEQLLNNAFYFKKQIVKPFSEEHEKVLWLKKTNEEIGKYISKTIETGFLTDSIHNPLGTGEVTTAGNLDTNLFLDASRNYFKANNSLLEEGLDYDSLTVSANGINYKEITADKLIFCEGYKAITNPYFSWLPFKLTKGETLIVRIPLLYQQNIASKILNKGVFILSMGDGLYKTGATYEWEDISDVPTAKGKAVLVEQLQKVLKIPFEIIDQQAGIRPTVKDRRPLIGIHPNYPSLGIFNGLGTKGVMLAPYFAKQFADFLESGIPLNKEADIARFKAELYRSGFTDYLLY